MMGTSLLSIPWAISQVKKLIKNHFGEKLVDLNRKIPQELCLYDTQLHLVNFKF